MDVLGLALILRLTAIFSFPSLHHPDENFQLLEQAHRFAFGYGVRPWEFEDGMRSLVVPYILGGVFALADAVFGGPEGYIYSTRIFLAVLSLIGIPAVYEMGLRTSRTHALLVSLVAATWFEIVYFSFRPLTEALAWDFLLLALASASRPHEELSRRRIATIGLYLGVSFVLRMHLFPGLLFCALWIGRFEVRKRWLPLLLGGLPPIIVFGVVDWITWGGLFHSYTQAIAINLLQGKAMSFGVRPLYWYFQLVYHLWAGALPALCFLILIRSRSSTLWIGVSLSIILSHSLIAHKEYRFIFPAVACLIIVAAMGSAECITMLQNYSNQKVVRYLSATAAALWVATSASLAFAPGFSDNWFLSRQLIDASFWLSSQPDLCGLLIYDYKWTLTGGYAHLHRNIPVYSLRFDHELARHSTQAFNFIILSRSSIPNFPEYTDIRCVGEVGSEDICEIKRAGACHRDPNLIPLLEQSHLGESVKK